MLFESLPHVINQESPVYSWNLRKIYLLHFLKFSQISLLNMPLLVPINFENCLLLTHMANYNPFMETRTCQSQNGGSSFCDRTFFFTWNSSFKLDSKIMGDTKNFVSKVQEQHSIKRSEHNYCCINIYHLQIEKAKSWCNSKKKTYKMWSADLNFKICFLGGKKT